MSKQTKAYVNKNRMEFNDADYLHKLNKEERDFYKNFQKEYYDNHYDKENSMHKTLDNYPQIKKTMKRACNAVNVDVMSNLKITGKLGEFNEQDEKQVKEKDLDVKSRLSTEEIRDVISSLIEEEADLIFNMDLSPNEIIAGMHKVVYQALALYSQGLKIERRFKNAVKKESI